MNTPFKNLRVTLLLHFQTQHIQTVLNCAYKKLGFIMHSCKYVRNIFTLDRYVCTSSGFTRYFYEEFPNLLHNLHSSSTCPDPMRLFTIYSSFLVLFHLSLSSLSSSSSSSIILFSTPSPLRPISTLVPRSTIPCL